MSETGQGKWLGVSAKVLNSLDQDTERCGKPCTANHPGAPNVNDLLNHLAMYRVLHNYRKSYRLRPEQWDDR